MVQLLCCRRINDSFAHPFSLQKEYSRKLIENSTRVKTKTTSKVSWNPNIQSHYIFGGEPLKGH